MPNNYENTRKSGQEDAAGVDQTSAAAMVELAQEIALLDTQDIDITSDLQTKLFHLLEKTGSLETARALITQASRIAELKAQVDQLQAEKKDRELSDLFWSDWVRDNHGTGTKSNP